MPDSSPTGLATLDVVIPVLNEAHVLDSSVKQLRHFLSVNMPYKWQIVVIDNGSEDGTADVGAALAKHFSDVKFSSISKRGRGRALRTAWLRSPADIVCYMDVDLSTDLRFLPVLADAIAKEKYDIAVGSRLASGSHTVRCLKREVISRLYNLFLKVVLQCKFSDAQCGFKAVSRRVVEEVVPQVQDQSWFFDTELLVLCERGGYRIKDVPVVWREDDDSRVKIVSTAWEDIKGVVRLRKKFWSRHRPPLPEGRFGGERF